MLQLLVFVAGVFGIGWLIGATNLPGEWYAGLAKPGFVPPNWAFPIAWTILYIMIGIAGWRTFRREPRGKAMLAWAAQMALNFLVSGHVHDAPDRRCARHPDLHVRRDRDLYRPGDVARQAGRRIVRALRRLGRICRRAQCGHLALELRRSVSIKFKERSQACEWQAWARDLI